MALFRDLSAARQKRQPARSPSLLTRIGRAGRTSPCSATSCRLSSISGSPDELEGGCGLERLELIGGSPEVNLDSGRLAEVLDLVSGDLDQAAEEELGRPEVGVRLKVSLGHDAD